MFLGQIRLATHIPHPSEGASASQKVTAQWDRWLALERQCLTRGGRNHISWAFTIVSEHPNGCALKLRKSDRVLAHLLANSPRFLTIWSEEPR